MSALKWLLEFFTHSSSESKQPEEAEVLQEPVKVKSPRITVHMLFEGEHFQYWYYAENPLKVSINAFGPVYLEKPKPGEKKYDGTEPETQICMDIGKRIYNGMCKAVDNDEVYAVFELSEEEYQTLTSAGKKSPVRFTSELSEKNEVYAMLTFPPLPYY